jgi:hypothetical protein
MQDVCTNTEKCANCASEFHSTADCSRAPKCVSCGNSSSHLSSSPTCPAFLCKSEALVEHYPENAMPYYLTKENWTWSTSSPHPLTMVAPLPAPSLVNSSLLAKQVKHKTALAGTLPLPFCSPDCAEQIMAGQKSGENPLCRMCGALSWQQLPLLTHVLTSPFH